MIMVLALTTVVLGLAACRGTAENQDLQAQTTATEQGVREVSSGNTDATSGNVDTNTDPNTNYSAHIQNPISNEIIAGSIKAINGMSITIDTSSVFMAHETGSHIATGEPPELQKEIIHLTEQTTIEIRTLANGQIIGSSVGTIDDLTLQAIIMAEGEWQDSEFVVSDLTIMNF